VKESASPDTLRIAALEDRPLPILEQVFNDTNHLGYREPVREHLADGLASLNLALRNLNFLGSHDTVSDSRLFRAEATHNEIRERKCPQVAIRTWRKTGPSVYRARGSGTVSASYTVILGP
jgi:hypothetical protein